MLFISLLQYVIKDIGHRITKQEILCRYFEKNNMIDMRDIKLIFDENGCVMPPWYEIREFQKKV